jgi:DNA-binding GntR family transcriptional regulator
MRESNALLHGTILRVARNTRIAESVRLFSAQLEHIILMLTGRERYELSYREHLEIIEALAQRDPDLAERAMRGHVSSVKHDVLKVF